MQIIENKYTYGISPRKLDKIIKKIKHGKKISKLHLVTLPLFEDGILEIYVYNQLLQPYYKTLDEKIVVVGMTLDKGEANNIVTDIVQGMCDAGIDFNVREYLGI
ncbi:MAG: hypothetical protein IJX12_03660 [Lachnospiraceae bacterium]|nr:hypothetical protein [Lachnospiraceae bacterium]